MDLIIDYSAKKQKEDLRIAGGWISPAGN